MNCSIFNFLFPALLLAFIGCAHHQTRLQSEDEPDRHKEAELKTIGEITGYANADPIPVSGVGLVVGLDATGGDAPPGSYRRLLEDQLVKKGAQHVRDVLTAPENSLVLVSGLIPAGARKGDVFDVEVTLPPGSQTKSLRGGYLKECVLVNYDSTKNINPNYEGSNKVLMGHPLAIAGGRLLVGLGDGDEAASLRHGRIWGGARSKIDRPLALILNADSARGPVAQRVAERINEAFHGPYHGALNDMAVAKTGSVIYLKVPEQYRYNLPRFMRLVRLIPLQDSADTRGPYRRHLERQLLDPAHTVSAALRLEALGAESIDVLKHGLKSENTLVRFCSAEALAYLDCPTGGEELGRLIRQQPELRAYCFTALASLDESISRIELGKLLDEPVPEIRYGAFRALRSLDEREPAVRGELLNDSFWLHRVASKTPPLVHLSCSRRAEVVLFGEEPQLAAPFSFLAGEFTVIADREDEHCTISRFSVRHGTTRRQCSLRVEDVLRTLADMGGLYPDVLELLQQAGTYECLNCQLKIDALPQTVPVEELAKKAASDPNFLRTAQDTGSSPGTATLPGDDRREGSSQPAAAREKVTQDGAKASAAAP